MLAPLITSVVRGEAAIAAKRAKAAFGAYVAAALLVLIGTGFLLLAAFIALADRIGPLLAALWLGGGFLVAGILLVILHRMGAARAARRDAERRAREAAAIATATAAALAPLLVRPRNLRTVLGIAGAAAAGYAILRENRSRRPRPDTRR